MIIKKSPAEIDKMAAAGAILVKTMDLLAGKIRPGVTTARARQGGREVHPLAGRDAGLQGLPRLPRLDLRVAEPHGRARHPGQVQALARATCCRSTSASSTTAGSPTPRARSRSARSRRSPSKLLEVTEGSLFKAVEQCRAGNRLGDVSHAVQEHVEANGFSIVRSLVGHGIGRVDARGAADPQLRPARQGHPARGGHGPRRRADGHRRPPHGPHGRRRLGDLLPGRLAGRPLRVHDRRSPPTARASSRRARGILTPWHESKAAAAA